MRTAEAAPESQEAFPQLPEGISPSAGGYIPPTMEGLRVRIQERALERDGFVALESHDSDAVTADRTGEYRWGLMTQGVQYERARHELLPGLNVRGAYINTGIRETELGMGYDYIPGYNPGRGGLGSKNVRAILGAQVLNQGRHGDQLVYTGDPIRHAVFYVHKDVFPLGRRVLLHGRHPGQI